MENHPTGGPSNLTPKDDDHVLRLPLIHKPHPPTSSRPKTSCPKTQSRRYPHHPPVSIGAGNACILPSIQQKQTPAHLPTSEKTITHLPRPPSKSPQLKPSRTMRCIKRATNELSEKSLDPAAQYGILPMIHPHSRTPIARGESPINDKDKVFGGRRQPLPNINLMKDEINKYVVNNNNKKPKARLLTKRPKMKKKSVLQRCPSSCSSTHSVEATIAHSDCCLQQPKGWNYRPSSTLSQNSTSEVVIEHHEFWDGPFSEQICMVQSSYFDLQQPSEEGIQKQRGFLDLNDSNDLDLDTTNSIGSFPSNTQTRLSPRSGLSNHSLSSCHQ